MSSLYPYYSGKLASLTGIIATSSTQQPVTLYYAGLVSALKVSALQGCLPPELIQFRKDRDQALRA